MSHRISFFVVLLLCSLRAFAQESLETIEVQGDSFVEYWEENKDAKIFSGKKNTVTDLTELPQLQTNNYRQATSQTPGLLISEVPNEALAAITYRGLGDPHESYNVLLLQDGIPVAADMYGYPAHYFSPALPMMDKFQFIRGGAALIYGPQPGGVVNYISRPLQKNQATSGEVSLSGGSYNLLTTNNALYGSRGDSAFGVEYYRRQGDGPRRENSDFSADYLQARNHFFRGQNIYKVSFNGYNSDHGEPGGHAKEAGADRAAFGKDEGKATKLHDRLKVSRAQLALGAEVRIDDDSTVEATLWGSAYRRYSKRQTGGGFGTFTTGTTNDITTQHYYGYNAEVRYLRNYGDHTFSAGYLNYNLNSPIIIEAGASPGAEHGTVTRRLERTTRTNSIFAENRFSFGKLMVTPGVRIENIRQSIEERKSPNGVLRDSEETVNVPLFGLGLSWHVDDETQIYGNVSEAYKPVSYAEAVPLGASTTVSEDIDPSKIISYELGYRGTKRKVTWDVSAFFIRFENKFGQVGSGSGINYQNTGAGESRGVDLAGTYSLRNDLSIYGNLAVLDAKFTNGPLEGKTPQHAPKTITRTGLIYNKENRHKIALMGVMVGSHYGDDSNSNQFEIPFYTVWDLTGEWVVARNWTVNAGINNLLDREYYSRVRGDGVQWALGRNVYAGLGYRF